ncbi:hypothetical protein Tco_1210929 [Tanacetum coccineum]
MAAIVNKLENLGRDMKKLKESVHAIQVGCQTCGGVHLDKDCPLNEEVKNVEEVKYGEFSRPFPNNYKNDDRFNRGGYDQPSLGERRPNLTEIINKYMVEASKKHVEQDEWLRKFYQRFSDSERQETDDSRMAEALVALEATLKKEEKEEPKKEKQKVNYYVDPYELLIPFPRRLEHHAKETFLDFNNALADLGASISIMPLSMYKRLGIGKLKPINMVIEMADNTKCTPEGIDAYHPRETLISHYIHAKVDIFKKSISLEVRNKKVVFKMRSSFTTNFESVRSIKSETYPEDDDFNKIDFDLFLCDSESYEFNRLLGIDPDIFSYEINIQESYEEIVYKITELEKEKCSAPQEKKVHWCRPILKEKGNERQYWASCNPYSNICDGGDLLGNKEKHYWESVNDSEREELEWENLSLNYWMKIRYRKVCKVTKERILKDHWREGFRDEEDDPKEDWEDPDEYGEDKAHAIMEDVRNKLDDEWFNNTNEDKDDLEGILDYLEPRTNPTDCLSLVTGDTRTLSLDELRSPDFNLLSDQEYSEEEEAEAMQNQRAKMEEINNFQQELDETLYQARERFKELLMKCPQHYLTKMQEAIQEENMPLAYSICFGNQDLESTYNKTEGMAAIVNKLENLGRDMKKLKESVHAIQVGCQTCGGVHLDKDCPLNEEVNNVEEVKYGEFSRPFPNNYKNDDRFNRGGYDQPSLGERRPNLTEIINKYMVEASKKHVEQDEWLRKFYQSEGRANNGKFEECKTICTKDGSPLYTPFYYPLEEIEYFSANSGFSDSERQETDDSRMAEALVALEATLKKEEKEEPKKEKQKVNYYVDPYELLIPFPRRLEHHAKETFVHKTMESLKKIKINHPLLKEVRKTDNYPKHIKNLVENKQKLKKQE